MKTLKKLKNVLNRLLAKISSHVKKIPLKRHVVTPVFKTNEKFLKHKLRTNIIIDSSKIYGKDYIQERAGARDISGANFA